MKEKQEIINREFVRSRKEESREEVRREQDTNEV